MQERVVPESLEDNAPHIWSKVDIKNEDDCWNWTACVARSGRGSFSDGKYVKRQAHRVAYWLATGEEPRKKMVLHSCDNPICCNPKHLFLGSHADNMKDMANKQRNRTPRPGNGYTKITLDQHSEICLLFENGVSKKEIGRRFNCTATNIRSILSKYGYKPQTFNQGSR